VSTLSELRRKFRAVWPHLDERTRRLTVANEALSLGDGGVSRAHRASGVSRKAIAKGIRELRSRSGPGPGRIRRPGAGRKPITMSDPGLVPALAALIDGQTRGDPESPLRWICQGTRTIARELGRGHHAVSHVKVAQLLHALDYSLQGTRKTEEGTDHPDRDAQFRYITAAVKQSLAHGLPVISVDTKKKDLLGRYHNAGRHGTAGVPTEPSEDRGRFADPFRVPLPYWNIGAAPSGCRWVKRIKNSRPNAPCPPPVGT